MTLEANPEDVTRGGRRAPGRPPASTGSRSGVQSLEDRELAAVGRRHDAARAPAALEILAGGRALGLGRPDPRPARADAGDLPAERRRRSLRAGVEHVSVYLLETEKSKTIEEDRRRDPERYLSDDAQADLWLEMGETLAAGGVRALRDLQLGAPGAGGAAQRQVLDARRRRSASASRRTSSGPAAGAPTCRPSRSTSTALEAGRRPLAFDRAIDPAEAAREEIFLGPAAGRGVAAADLEAVDRARRGRAALGRTTRAGWPRASSKRPAAASRSPSAGFWSPTRS